MKKIIFALLTLLISVLTLFGQQQLNHEKRTYIGPDGKFYINRALPVYLWLSTSPTDKSNATQLKSSTEPNYSNPMYFDTEGINNITHEMAVDQTTKAVVDKTVNFQVYADGIAPYSTSSFSPAPKFVSDGIIYYGKGLTVTLKSTDEVSGVEKTYFSINGENYQDYSSIIPMDKEQAYILKYYASDFVGNAENPTTKKYTVDLSAPKTNHSVSQPKLDDIISPKANISLSFSDNLSGVRNTRYYFDNNAPLFYGVPITLWNLTDGNHNLTYYSTDNVSNVENKVVYSFYLDKTPPVVTQDIVGDLSITDCKYISSRTKIKLSATDNKAGVDKVFYSIDVGGQLTYGDQFLVPNNDGQHTITYWGIDKVTNLAAKKYLTVCMDNTNPATHITYGNPQFFDRDTLFINKLTPVTLHPNDGGSGVLKTEYNINNNGNSKYSSSFKIPEEGYKTIGFFSTDKVNNVETQKTSHCFVDNTPPVIYVRFSIDPIDKRDGLNVYPNYTRMYVAATDKQVGTQEIMYSVNGSPMKLWSSQYTLDASEVQHFTTKNKKYVVKIQSKDKLGNMSEYTIEFYVSK